MRGYKAFNSNMTGIGFQYEIGKTYEIGGQIKLGKRGFHFCSSLANVYEYYPKRDKTRVCEIEAEGDIETDGFKYVTNKIRIIKEITGESRKANTGHGNVGYCNTGSKNVGNRNTGSRNIGSLCSGDWNIADHSSGCFNVTKQYITMFDEQTEWTYDMWLRSLARTILLQAPFGARFVKDESETNGHYEDCTREEIVKWWDDLAEKHKDEIRNLPNYNEDKFLLCIGYKRKNSGQDS